MSDVSYNNKIFYCPCVNYLNEVRIRSCFFVLYHEFLNITK